jgi:hypothetical protein
VVKESAVNCTAYWGGWILEPTIDDQIGLRSSRKESG